MPVVTLAGVTMGTTWRVLFAREPQVDPEVVAAAITARLDDVVAQMSHWDPGSILSAFNRARPGQWLALPRDFARVMAKAMEVAEETGGAFDPGMGAVVDLWGYGPPGPMQPPSDSALAAARARSGWRRIAFDASAARVYQPGGVALDLSGIAKGYAVDAVADLLAGMGIHHALVEIGGELVGRGIRPDGEPWWVDLENPPGADLLPLRIALHGLAVATSGDYRRGTHTIDPRSGRPIANRVAAVSVIAATAIMADAWATAITVLGPEDGMAAAARRGIAARLILRAETGWDEQVSPALTAMLDGSC